MTDPNPIIADRFPPTHDAPSPLSRDEEIARLQVTVALLVRCIHTLTERQQALESQQVQTLMARRRRVE